MLLWRKLWSQPSYSHLGPPTSMKLCSRWAFSDSRKWLLMLEFEPSRKKNLQDFLHVTGKTLVEISDIRPGSKPTMVNIMQWLCFLTDSYNICFFLFKYLIFSKTLFIYPVTKWEHKNKECDRSRSSNRKSRSIVMLYLWSLLAFLTNLLSLTLAEHTKRKFVCQDLLIMAYFSPNTHVIQSLR